MKREYAANWVPNGILWTLLLATAKADATCLQVRTFVMRARTIELYPRQL